MPRNLLNLVVISCCEQPRKYIDSVAHTVACVRINTEAILVADYSITREQIMCSAVFTTIRRSHVSIFNRPFQKSLFSLRKQRQNRANAKLN